MLLSKLAYHAAHENDVLRISRQTYRKRYRSVVKNMVRCLGDGPIDELDPVDVARWQKEVEGSELAVTTANSYVSTAKAMFNRVGRADLSAALSLRPKPPRKSKAMKPAHFQAMLMQANIRDQAILLLLRDSGRRRATICELTVDGTRIYQGPDGEFRLAARTIEKGERTQLVFARHEAAIGVMHWLNNRPFPDAAHVFTSLRRPAPITPDTVTAIFRDLQVAANIPRSYQCSPHTLRHAFAQAQLERVDARLVADWMGIKVQTLLQVYATRSEDELERLFFADD